MLKLKMNYTVGLKFLFLLFFQPGDTLVIKIKTDLPAEKIKENLNSQKINFSKMGQDLIEIFGISVKEKLGKYNLTLDFPEGEFLRSEN